jgi:hypothetical protein
MRERNISWTTASAGFVFLALMLAGDGFLLSKDRDDPSTGMQARSPQLIWETVMKGLSHHAHNSDRL